MKEIKAEEKFRFTYLPDYARWLLENRLEEYVLVSIRFCREVDLPLLKPLSKFTEQDLVALSIESNKEALLALANNRIEKHINQNLEKWKENKLVVVDKEEILAEDLTLAFYLRRKSFAYFLDAYTKNIVLQKFIIAEVDYYTSQEELLSYNLYMELQKEKLIKINAEITHHKELLLEAQGLSHIGSFLVNFNDHSKTFYTPEHNAILGIDGNNVPTFEQFLETIHPEDRHKLEELREKTLKTNGRFELEYRCTVDGKEKHIFTKGVSIMENGKPNIIRGTVMEMVIV